MAKANEGITDKVACMIGNGINKAIASAIEIIPGAEKSTAKKVIRGISYSIPLVFEYIGQTIIDGENPKDFGIDTPVLYDAFREEWEVTHDTTLPEYKQFSLNL